ncbi:hypothetical protein EMMF5_000180 [Cystobasidiomycetes sp. EMM_F5]
MGKVNLHKVEPYELPTPKAVFNIKVYLVALMSTAAALDYGYDLGFIGTTQTLAAYQSYMGTAGAAKAAFRAEYNSNVVALFQAGAIVGSLAPAALTSRFGRRPVNIALAVLFIVGSIVQSVAGMGGTNPNAMMLAGRFINGISVGGSNSVAPFLVSEMSPPSIRGRLVGMYEIGVQMGTLLGFWICYGLVRNHAADEMQWRIPFILQLIFGGLYLFGAIFTPESPRYLAKFGRERVSRAMAYIRNLPESDAWLNIEVDEICAQYEAEKGMVGVRGFFQELKQKSIRNRFIMITILMIFFQFSGTNSVNYYSPQIFAKLGITGQTVSFLATGIYGVIRFSCVVVAMFYLVDRFGRRVNLLTGAAVMALCMWIIGALVKTSTGGIAAPLTLIYIYAAAFVCSYAGIPYIINTEIWPSRLRPIGISWGVFVHWVFNLVIGKSTPYMVESLDYGFFWLYAGFLSVSCFFIYFFVPETRNISLERMEEVFGGSAASTHVQRSELDGSHSESEAASQKGEEMPIEHYRK